MAAEAGAAGRRRCCADDGPARPRRRPGPSAPEYPPAPRWGHGRGRRQSAADAGRRRHSASGCTRSQHLARSPPARHRPSAEACSATGRDAGADRAAPRKNRRRGCRQAAKGSARRPRRSAAPGRRGASGRAAVAAGRSAADRFASGAWGRRVRKPFGHCLPRPQRRDLLAGAYHRIAGAIHQSRRCQRPGVIG